ncbi:LysR family transcriptional regulator [Actinomycetospora sp. OC33-EN08]|uniref:LysR family transcriptional regulator n=1 Tax=Actinomycetospora aurantiaca TaxID=3129233 RepID=A0ABU8MKJ7_9PSEU
MELRQLEYVVAVAEELHFGRAAERVHVRQQSVSEQVARLERELGGPLFARTSRRVELTAAGEAFLPEARAVLAAAARALAAGRRAAGGVRELRVGYAEDLGTELFTRATGVRVVPVPMSTPEQLTAIADRRLDAGWCWEPELPPELDAEVVGREAAMIVLTADDPAATGPVDPASLVGRSLAVVPRSVNPWLHERFVAGLRSRGADVVVAHDAVRLDRLVPLVLSGVAVGITQQRALAGGLPSGLVALPLVGDPLTVEHRLVWRREDGRPPL